MPRIDTAVLGQIGIRATGRQGRAEDSQAFLNPDVACGNAGEFRIENVEMRMGRVLPSPMNLTNGKLWKQR